MALYMTQFSYTVETWQTMMKNPQDRSGGLRSMMDKLGGKLHAVYYCMGDYDGVVLFEAPNDETASAGIIAAIGPGHLKATKLTRLFTVDETLGILRTAGDQVYPGPKQ